MSERPLPRSYSTGQYEGSLRPAISLKRKFCESKTDPIPNNSFADCSANAHCFEGVVWAFVGGPGRNRTANANLFRAALRSVLMNELDYVARASAGRKK